MGLSVKLFALAFFIQTISSQGIGSPLNAGLNFNGLPFGANFANGLVGPGLGGPGLTPPGFGAAPNTAASGGGFMVTSTSHIAPTGVSILAENLGIEGPLSVGGQLPFLGSIGLEGALPAFGSGAVSYGCGGGSIGITSEGPVAQSPYGLSGQAYGTGQINSGYALPNSGLGPIPGYGVGLAGSNYAGAGFSGPGIGPGLAGAGFGSGYGNGLIGQGFGGALPGPGLGYNGIGGAGLKQVL